MTLVSPVRPGLPWLHHNVVDRMYVMVTKSYRAAYERSLEHPAEFWLEAAEGISWRHHRGRPSTRAGHRSTTGFRTGS